MNKQRVTNGEPKHRVKLYKAGKLWLAMGITSAALGLATIATTSSVTVKADTTDATDTTQTGETSAAVTDSEYALKTGATQESDATGTQTSTTETTDNSGANSGNDGATDETNTTSTATTSDVSDSAAKTVSETPATTESVNNETNTDKSNTGEATDQPASEISDSTPANTTETSTNTKKTTTTTVKPTTETVDANGAITRTYVGAVTVAPATATTTDTTAQQTTVTFTTTDGKTLSQTISGRIGDADFDTQVNAVIADLKAKGYTVNVNGYQSALHGSGYASSLLGVTLEQAEKIITDKMAQSVSDYNTANPDHTVVTVAAGTTDQTAASVISNYAANGYTGNETVLLYAYTQENYEQFMERTLLTPLDQDEDAKMALQVLSQYNIVPYWKLDGKITTDDGYSITKVNSVMSLPTSKVPSAVTVFFTPDQQSYQVNYVDDTTGKTIQSLAIWGATDELLNTDSATQTLSTYLANGYVLVSSGVPATNTLTVVPSNYTGTDTTVALAGSKYEVHMTHGTTTYTADNPVPGTTADAMQATDYVQVSFKYADKDRTKAFDTIVVPVNETRTVVVDNVTGSILSDTWALADGQATTLDAIDVPEVAGYTSNYPDGIPALDVATLVQDGQLGGISYSVSYKANNATLTVDTTGAGDKTPAGQSVTTTTGKSYTVILPSVTGYTASLETIGDAVADPKPGATIIAPTLNIDPITGSAVITGTGTASDQNLVVKYTANSQTLTVSYVDDDSADKAVVSTDTVTGVTDGTGTYTVVTPDKYVLSDGQSASVDYTFTTDDSDNVTIHLSHHKTQSEATTTRTVSYVIDGTTTELQPATVQDVKWTVSTDDVTNEATATPTGNYDAITAPEIEGYTANNNVAEQVLTEGQLPENTTATISYSPVEKTLTIHYTGTPDGKTPADQPVQTTYDKGYTVTVPTIEGYTPTASTGTLTTDPETGVTTLTGTGTATDQNVTVTYTANPQKLTVTYVDDSTKATLPDLTETLTGTTDQTGTYTVKVPAGYQLSNGQTDKVDYTFTADDSDNVTIHLTKIAAPDNGGTTTPNTDNGAGTTTPTTDGNQGTTTDNSTGVTTPSTNGQITPATGDDNGQKTTGNKTPAADNDGESTDANNGSVAAGNEPGSVATTEVSANAQATNPASKAMTTASAQATQAATLPQTNDNNDAKTATAGLALLAMVSGLLGFGAKKRRQDNE